MKYMGSKARFAKELLDIILKDRADGQYYIEPFCGGCNVIDKVIGKRMASDNNKYLIEMWKGLQLGRKAIKEITKDIYDKARIDFRNRSNKYFDNFEIGWIGFMASANGRFFDGGYSGISYTKLGTQRNYIEESIRNINKQLSLINGIEYFNCDYENLIIPDTSIIYCDPPYANTKQYTDSLNFNYHKFWDWVRSLSNAGHKVFISEYSAPTDFEMIWSKSVKSSLSANAVAGGNKNSIEKLFVIKNY